MKLWKFLFYQKFRKKKRGKETGYDESKPLFFSQILSEKKNLFSLFRCETTATFIEVADS